MIHWLTYLKNICRLMSNTVTSQVNFETSKYFYYIVLLLKMTFEKA